MRLLLIVATLAVPCLFAKDAPAREKLDPAAWTPRNAPELMGLFSRLFAGYAEFDGALRMTISINEAPDGATYEVFIAQDGYGDDSVSGARWAAKVKPDGTGWVLDSIWRQQRCARGGAKGKWTKQSCP